MDNDRKILRLGAVVILCAIVLRLLGSVGLGSAVSALSQSEAASVMLFLQTGRVVRQAQTQTQAQEEPEQTQPQSTQPEAEISPVVFSQEDAQLVSVNSYTSYETDLEAMLQQPLSWDLTQEEPTVLILHTHGSESYTQTEDYVESASYRTLDDGYNVVSIGDRLTELLEEKGIRVIHDRTLHDYPSYNGSYEDARQKLRAYLSEYPSICLVLDIHRDAMEDASGSQIGYTVQTEKGTAAKLMLVVGTDAGGLTHPNWRENMALAVKLQAQLEKVCPGICRPISLRTSRFNQDLTAGAVLVEVGAAGNTRQEALTAAEYLAEGILALANGTTS